MPNQFIDNIIQGVFHRLGLRVARLSSSFEAAMSAVMSRHNVNCVIDVGANAGQFAMELRERNFSGTVHSFEPLPDVAEELRAVASKYPRWHVHQCALSDSSGQASFFVTSNRVSSSLLKPREFDLHSKVGAVAAEPIRVPMRTLNSFAKNELQAIDWSRTFLKIDVQGAEERVLRGSTDVLGRVPMLLTEVSLQSLYDGSPSWTKVVDLCAEHSLTVTDIQRGFRDPHAQRVLQVDLLMERIEIA